MITRSDQADKNSKEEKPMETHPIGRYLVFGLMIVGIFGALAHATPSGADIVDNGAQNANLVTGSTDAVVGGIIYQINLNATSTTNLWAAANGNVTGYIALRGSNKYSIKNWTSSNSALFDDFADTSEANLVIAYNGTSVPAWANIAPDALTGAEIDTRLGLDASKSDAASQTFDGSVTGYHLGNQSLVTIASAGANLIFYNYTNKTSGAHTAATNNARYQTAFLNDGTSQSMFVTRAVTNFTNNGGNSAFGLIKAYDNSSNVNFQLLLYANNSGTEATTTYYYYVELQ